VDDYPGSAGHFLALTIAVACAGEGRGRGLAAQDCYCTRPDTKKR